MTIKYRNKTFSKYNQPRRATDGSKKFEVLAKDSSGKVRLVRFGDKKGGLTVKKNQPDRKKSYCARSSGIRSKSGTSKVHTANYWSRKQWDC